jgi:hypothetical protein
VWAEVKSSALESSTQGTPAIKRRQLGQELCFDLELDEQRPGATKLSYSDQLT